MSKLSISIWTDGGKITLSNSAGFVHCNFIQNIFQRKQKEVQKENEFYVNLIQQALPTELQNQYIEKQKGK